MSGIERPAMVGGTEYIANRLEEIAASVDAQVKRKDEPSDVEVLRWAAYLVRTAAPEREPLPAELGNWEGEVLMMIVQRLEALGTDMKGTPPMMYDDAIQTTVYRWCKRALAGELEMRDGKIVPLEPIEAERGPVARPPEEGKA